TEWRACKEPVEAEALPGIVENEERLHEDEEDVLPRPLARVSVESQPKVRDEEHANDTQGTYEEAQDEGDGQGQLGEEDQRVDDRQQGNEDVFGDPAVEFEGRVLGERACPSGKSSGDWQR